MGSQFGPGCEAFVDIVTKPGDGETVSLLARFNSGGGYLLHYQIWNSATDELKFYRLDAGVSTQIGSTIPLEFSAGDGLALKIFGNNLTAYRRSGGTWLPVGSTTDNTYSGAGYIGMSLESGIGRLDNFGGGTRTQASAPSFVKADSGNTPSGNFKQVSYSLPGENESVLYQATAAADTIGVFRPNNQIWYLRNSNTAGYEDFSARFGNATGDYPIAGDWDGNGTTTIGVFRSSERKFLLRNSNTNGYADIVFAFGQPGDQPIAGDWDGDGIDTIGIYQNGNFYLRNSNSAGAVDYGYSLGISGDIAIAGDWNGDGLDTGGVFRANPSNGTFYLTNSNDQGFANVVFNYGAPTDKPIAGDWNSDGIDTIGIFRPGEAKFYLRNANSEGGANLVFVFGLPTDIPLAGNWDGDPPMLPPTPTPTPPPSGGSMSASFAYDGNGQRVKSSMTTSSGTTTTYFVGAHYEVANGVVTKYYYAGSQRIAMRTNGRLKFLLGDHLGSTSLVTDAAGNNVIETRYKAWGEVRYASGNTPTNYTFTGQMSDSYINLLDYGSRRYDPELGRFIQPDSIIPDPSNSQGWDRYAYTFNNPVRYVDPDGHDPITALLLLFAATAVLTACAPEPAPAPEIASTVNIADAFGTHISLGTAINSDTAITHNHYDENPNITLWDLNADWHPIKFFDPVGPEVYGSGQSQTGLVTVGSDFKGSPAELASQDVISSLGMGNTVQVVYWDDTELAMGSFTVQAPPSSGVLLLNDPDEILNLGDSGGGVFYNGQLIGNLWSEDKSGHTIFVAILPADLTSSSKATTPVRRAR